MKIEYSPLFIMKKIVLYLIILIWIAWIQPSTNVDGTILLDLAGNKFYCGNQSRIYIYSWDLGLLAGPGEQASLWINNSNIPIGEWYCAMTAYDEMGNESSYSNEIYGVKY